MGVFKTAYIRGYKTPKKSSTALSLYIEYFRDSVLSKKVLPFWNFVDMKCKLSGM
jgi:hypothetical protein